MLFTAYKSRQQHRVAPQLLPCAIPYIALSHGQGTGDGGRYMQPKRTQPSLTQQTDQLTQTLLNCPSTLHTSGCSLQVWDVWAFFTKPTSG
jgi:hypothetical protein